MTPQRGQRRAREGGPLGSGKWLTQWTEGCLNSSGPEPQGPGFPLSSGKGGGFFSEEWLTAAAAVLDPPPGTEFSRELDQGSMLVGTSFLSGA